MPQGFSVETGFDLSKRLLAIVGSLKTILQNARRESERGPGNPMSAGELCDRLGTFGNVKDSDIRAMVNFLRRNKQPVGSNADGYFWAINHMELEFTRQHLSERIAGIQSALDGVNNAEFESQELL